MDFTYIERIIAVVRVLLGDLCEYSDIVSCHADIHLTEVAGNVFLESIKFSWYDTLIVTQTRIMLRPEYGSEKVVMEYTSFDELLSKGEKI